jgi:hypothetical protein
MISLDIFRQTFNRLNQLIIINDKIKNKVLWKTTDPDVQGNIRSMKIKFLDYFQLLIIFII